MGKGTAFKNILKSGAKAGAKGSSALLKSAGLTAGLVIGGASLAMVTAAITGKCGGNMFGMISIGDCAGDYSMNVDTDVFYKMVKNYENRVTQTSTNTTVISSIQNIEILNPPPSCKINIEQTFTGSLQAKFLLDEKVKRETTTDIMTELANNIDQKFKEINGFLSSGSPGPDISAQIVNRIKLLSENNDFIGKVISTSNSYIQIQDQKVRINYALPTIIDGSYYTSNSGCEINISQNTIISMQFDSIFQSVIDEINKDTIASNLANDYSLAVEKENKGLDSLVEAFGKWMENAFKILIVVAIIGMIGLYFFIKMSGGGNSEGGEGLSLTDLKKSASDIKSSVSRGLKRL